MLKAEIANYKNKVEVLERSIEHLKKSLDDKVVQIKDNVK